MTSTLSMKDRRRIAAEAHSALEHGGRDAIRLRVMCPQAHHVAVVYDTDVGLVYETPVRRHAHGDRDLLDLTHKTQRITHWYDLLDVDGDDALIASCECGERSLSRQALLEWIAADEKRVVID